MKFFKNLKDSILGSIKEDLNSALGGKQALFNSKISGALDDLIAMKTGINISNIPSKITEEAALAGERRRLLVKNPQEAVTSEGAYIQPSKREMLRFPTSNDRFVDNWIVFRTKKRTIPADYMRGSTYNMDISEAKKHGIKLQDNPTVDEKTGLESHQYSASQQDCSICLFFPNNVKDTISVDYETKEVGLGESTLNEALTPGDGGGLGAMDAFQEGAQGFQEAIKSATAQQTGIANANPKFLNFGGVQMREHTYTFALNPYNEADAKEIIQIIHWFKLMSLPMSSNKNPRISIMPAEWEIDFMGPILGHIEHPQNCYLSTVDVDYSGGKDMSFIESANYHTEEERKAAAKAKQEAERAGVELDDSATESVKHYPNGINLTLTFKETLNIDRLRYIGNVAASARGANQDTTDELMRFEYAQGQLSEGEAHSASESGDLTEKGRAEKERQKKAQKDAFRKSVEASYLGTGVKRSGF